jgi:hypothetical protein
LSLAPCAVLEGLVIATRCATVNVWLPSTPGTELIGWEGWLGGVHGEEPFAGAIA